MILGEELLQLKDVQLPGPIPFTWQRMYRSSRARDYGLGCGWSHEGCEFLEINQQSLNYYDNEGRSIPFRLPEIDQRSKYLAECLVLDRVSDNGFILRQEGQWDKVFLRPNGSIKTFRLTQWRHPAYVPAGMSGGARTAEKGFALNFHYNEQNRLTRIAGNWGLSLVLSRNAAGRIESLALSNDTLKERRVLAEYDYDDNGDLVAHRDAKGVGEQYRYYNHLLIQRTLKTGFNFYFEWDGDDYKARCTHRRGERGIYEHLFTWDSESKSSRVTDSRGFCKAYHYNDYGQIVSEIDNEGGVHIYTYKNGRKTGYTDPEGQLTEYLFDPENYPAGERDALGNTQTLGHFNGKPTTFTDKDKSQWRREHDRRGLLTSLIDPYGQVTRYSYNVQGLIASVVDPLGRKTLYRWSEQGQLQSLINADGSKRKFTYDIWGQVVSTQLFLNGKEGVGATRFDYSPTGKIEKVTNSAGEGSIYRYDENDQLSFFTDSQGRETEFIYDGLSQPVERIDPEGNSLRYEYDTECNLTTIINENHERYEFFYDGNGRLIKEIGFDGRAQHYTYNKAGHLIKHADGEDVVIEFERDALGRMLTKTSRSLSDKNAPVERTRYQYDAKGRIIETYNARQYVSFEYNHFGNVVKEHHSDISADNKRIKSSMVDIQFANIWPGICSGITLPDGQQIDYQFDDKNRLSDIVLNQRTLIHIERDTLGRETARQQGDLVTRSDYDPAGRLQKQSSFNKQNKSNGPIQRDYGYDRFGRLDRLNDGLHDVRYVYDLLNRLQKANNENDEAFEFDPAGNLISIDDSPPGKAEGNRLASQGDRKFSYDPRGNLIYENHGRESKRVTAYQYNLHNQLVRVDKDDEVTEYLYDPLGRRIAKKNGVSITRYLWAGDQMVQESRDNIKKTYVYEPESFRPVAMIQDGRVYHYHLDHLGTPRELTDDSGKMVWRMRYKAYGGVAEKALERVENNLRFQGQYFDEETGLHYNRHRYYDPEIGRFTTPDPIGLLGGLNNYQYVINPIQWVNPLGLTCRKNNDCFVEQIVTEYGAENPNVANTRVGLDEEVDYRERTLKCASCEIFVRDGLTADTHGVSLGVGSSPNGKCISVLDLQSSISFRTAKVF